VPLLQLWQRQGCRVLRDRYPQICRFFGRDIGAQRLCDGEKVPCVESNRNWHGAFSYLKDGGAGCETFANPEPFAVACDVTTDGKVAALLSAAAKVALSSPTILRGCCRPQLLHV
jgi:hypothetical protein